MRPLYVDHLSAGEIGKHLTLTTADVDFSGSQERKQLHSGLESLYITSGEPRGIHRQRSGVKAAHENIPELGISERNYVIRSLAGHGPKP